MKTGQRVPDDDLASLMRLHGNGHLRADDGITREGAGNRERARPGRIRMADVGGERRRSKDRGKRYRCGDSETARAGHRNSFGSGRSGWTFEVP